MMAMTNRMHKKVQLSDELSLQLRASLARAAAAWQRVAVSFDHSQGPRIPVAHTHESSATELC